MSCLVDRGGTAIAGGRLWLGIEVRIIQIAVMSLVMVVLLHDSLFPILGGRVKETKEDEIQWVYGENKNSRTLAFMEFENLSPNQREVYESYKSSIPRIIASRLQNDLTIDTPSNDFIPIRENVSSSYFVKEISFEDAGKQPRLMSEVLQFGLVKSIGLITSKTNARPDDEDSAFVVVTNSITNQTSLGEVVETEVVTNRILPEVENLDFFSTLTNRRVAYYTSNQASGKYVFYIFKKDPQLYFDPEILSPYQKYFVSNEWSLPVTREGYSYYPRDKNKKKKFTLSPKLYRLNDAPIGSVLSQPNIDYFVYGTYKVLRNQMELMIYVINTYEKKITHIYREKFPSSIVRSKTKSLDVLILSFIQKKSVIQNIQFASSPPGALLRLNNRFIGVLPQTLTETLEGEYTYEVWHPTQNLSHAYSDNSITEKALNLEESNTETEFRFEAEDKGVLSVDIKNQVLGNYYLNSKLVGAGKTSYTENLYPGDYFVSVAKSNYVTRNFKVHVEPNTRTSLSFDLAEEEPKSIWEEIFLNYNRNTKIFGAVGFGLGAASFGLFIHTLRLEDQKNSSQKRIEELRDAGLDYGDEEILNQRYKEDYNKYLSISLGVFSGSVVSLITMLVFHTLDVFDRHAPIETMVNHNGDVQIRYSKDL